MTMQVKNADGSIICDNCKGDIPAGATRCPNCGRDVIPDDMLAKQAVVERSFRERGLNDSLAVIRPLISAVIETVIDQAPQFPRQMLDQYIREDGVFRFLVELEKRGFRVVPIPVTKEPAAA